MSRRLVRLRSNRQRRRITSLRTHLEVMETRQLLSSTILVTTTADGVNVPGSLRAAIEAANADPHSTIEFDIFNIPGPQSQTTPFVISPTSPLPALTAPTTIDGYTEIGSSGNPSTETDDDIAAAMIRIDGALAGQNADGLTINAPNCTVDGLIVTDFSGNGVVLTGIATQGVWMWGNFIGTVPNTSSGRDFATGLGNAGAGIAILSSNNRIGGNNPGLRNVIQGNGTGISLVGPNGTGNLIQNNFILDNTGVGVSVDASNNTIGEDLQGGGNVISGNGAQGILITGGANAQGNEVVGNDIGTDIGIDNGSVEPLGMARLANGAQGILIDNSPNNTIGGLLTESKNVIAGNTLDGILIQGAASTGNVVAANWIGFNIVNNLESLDIPNQDGIHITSSGNTIGGTTQAAQNTIGVNQRYGIELDGATATGNVIEGNYVGLNPGGGSDFGNTLDGVYLNNAPNNTIGGTTAGARNVISGNNNGITLAGAGSTGNLIEGNFLGTKADGVTRLENSVNGILVQDAPANTIGGTASGTANVISGNNRGILITSTTSPGAQDNLVEGNDIGTDLTGTVVVGNSIDGIFITNTSNNTIGGTVAGAGNTIANNAGNGVVISSGSGNAILSNSITGNTLLGIDLQPNQTSPTILPNNYQPAPVLTAAAPSGGGLNVQGTLTAAGNTTYTLQFFSNATNNPGSQGAVYLGSATVTTNGSGVANLNINLPVSVPSGQFITATATDPNNNTSEFSNDVPSQPVSVAFSASAYTVDESAGTATITVNRTGGTGGQVLVSFATSDGTGTAGTDYTTTSGILTFNPNETQKTFTIPILNDPKVMPNATVNLTLTNPSGGATLGAISTATLTIINHNQLSAQFSASSYSVNENAGTATITVTRNSSSGSSSVNYQTGGGSATPGVNYRSTSGTLTFADGQTSATFPIPIVDALLAGGSETVGLTLGKPSSGIVGSPGTAVLTIHNNDQPGTIQFNSPSYSASQGSGKATINVVRTGGLGGQVTVSYNVSAGTALPNIEFTPVSGTLTFAPGQSSRTIAVPLVSDSNAPSSASVNLVLSHPTGGASLGSTSHATLTIFDNQQGSGGPSANGPGPVVLGLGALTNGNAVTAFNLTFNKPLNAASAQDVGNYGYFVLGSGRDNQFGTSDDFSVAIVSAGYNGANDSVTLVPQVPLPLNGFYKITVNPGSALAAHKGVMDTSGDLLDGANNGGSGTTFVGIVGLGTRLSYADHLGNMATIMVSGPGLIELNRGANGDAQALKIFGAGPRRTAVIGQGRLSLAGRHTGITIPVITGASTARMRLRPPLFRVGRILP